METRQWLIDSTRVIPEDLLDGKIKPSRELAETLLEGHLGPMGMELGEEEMKLVERLEELQKGRWE